MSQDSPTFLSANAPSMMPEIPGYELSQRIYAGKGSQIYRGHRTQDRYPVILKIFPPDSDGHGTPLTYKQEHDILRHLNAAGLVTTLRLESYRDMPVLVLDDTGGTSLNHKLKEWQQAGTTAFPVLKFIELAQKIIEEVARLHGAGIIHKNITPANIVFNADTQELALIDFGISTTLKREMPELKSPRVLEGTPAYISPEQTGRMNRTVDYRTDFYAVGVAFYELLTGRLPFEAKDTVEMVHCHLAKTPMPPPISG